MRAVKRLPVGSHGDFPNVLSPNISTDLTCNFRMFRKATCDIRNPSAVYVGFCTDKDGEYDFPNAVSYHTAIEYPAGVVHEFTVSNRQGVTLTVPAGSVWSETDRLRGFFIPKGAWFWISGFLSVQTGQTWYYTDQVRDDDSGARREVGAALSDKTLVPLTIAASGGFVPGPVCLMGDAVPSTRSFALAHDSIGMGTGGYNSVLGARGYMASYLQERYSYVHFGRSGSAAQDYKSQLTRRLQFAARSGFTDLWCELGVNDFTSGSSSAVLASDVAVVLAEFAAANPKFARFYQSTITPRVTLSDGGPTGPSNQTVHGSQVDGRRNTFNTLVKANGITGQTGFVDAAPGIERVGNTDLWIDNGSDDGLHPSATGGAALVTRCETQNALAL